MLFVYGTLKQTSVLQFLVELRDIEMKFLVLYVIFLFFCENKLITEYFKMLKIFYKEENFVNIIVELAFHFSFPLSDFLNIYLLVIAVNL